MNMEHLVHVLFQWQSDVVFAEVRCTCVLHAIWLYS